MPETHSWAQFEASDIALESDELRLEEAFWSLEGFEAFRDITLPSLDQDVQDNLIAVILDHAGDEAFLGELDSFSGDGFPADTYSARSMIER